MSEDGKFVSFLVVWAITVVVTFVVGGALAGLAIGGYWLYQNGGEWVQGAMHLIGALGLVAFITVYLPPDTR